MKTSKSTSKSARLQVPKPGNVSPVSPLLDNTFTPNVKQKEAINWTMHMLSEYWTDLDESLGSLMGMKAWFHEYCKSATWTRLSEERKDEAFRIYEKIFFFSDQIRDQGQLIFPDGERTLRTDLFTIPNSK